MVNYKYMRCKKAEKLKQMYGQPFQLNYKPQVQEFEDAVILPLRQHANDNLLFGRGGVVNKEGNYIPSSAIPNRVEMGYDFNCNDNRDETVVYCGYFPNQWGHFLVEGVARLWYSLKGANKKYKYIFFIEENGHREIKGNYKEFFQLLGIIDNVELISHPVRYKKVIVPELAYGRSVYGSEEFKGVFDYIASNVRSQQNIEKYKKIFFSRSSLDKAKTYEFGLNWLDKYFEKNGYHILHPETVALSDLILYMKNATEIASASGSLPHNLLFTDEHKKIYIIERFVLNNEIQVDINRMKNFEVEYIDAFHAPFFVDLSGPTIQYNTLCMKRFTYDHGYLEPSIPDNKEDLIKGCAIAYYSKFRMLWYMDPWAMDAIESFREAYLDAQNEFFDYLNGTNPMYVFDYLRIHRLVHIVKRLFFQK